MISVSKHTHSYYWGCLMWQEADVEKLQQRDYSNLKVGQMVKGWSHEFCFHVITCVICQTVIDLWRSNVDLWMFTWTPMSAGCQSFALFGWHARRWCWWSPGNICSPCLSYIKFKTFFFCDFSILEDLNISLTPMQPTYIWALYIGVISYGGIIISKI